MAEAEHSIGQGSGPTGGTDRLKDSALSGGVCLADFTPYPPRVDYSGFRATAAGVVECEAIDCFFNGGIEIDANGEGDDAGRVAAAKVKSRARRQMAYECREWTSDTVNVGKPIPDERLPQSLQRNPQP